ncbi:hypothetical protein Goshw_007107, partial [Gossypium schwendimanii]|nr:hypothetical protein [Gossypium schwendimanii]
EEIEVNVFKKLEKRKVLSNFEKAGLLSKAEELVVALVAVVIIPDDSVGLMVLQVVVAKALVIGAIGLFVGSVILVH